jgi:1-acyl-sn-glycerol-3-phosphate acyltransferase
MVPEPAGLEPEQDETLAATVLETVDGLARELHPGAGPQRPTTLDSRLDSDLGLDSLAMAELLVRLQAASGVNLGGDGLIAESPRDLMGIVLARRGATRARAAAVQYELPDAALGVPGAAQTLPEVLEWHVKRHPDRVHVYLYENGDAPAEITYGQLHRGAQDIAAGLRHEGLGPGDTIAIMLPTGRAYLDSFFGVLMAGCVPVPIYPPTRRSQIAEHLRRHAAILGNAAVRLLITVSEAKLVGHLLAAQVPSMEKVLTPADLVRRHLRTVSVPRRPEDIAFLQYTSGSTGDPKGVVLTHQNLLANIRAVGRRVQAESTDVFVSWLPLYHDMGLIGAWLATMYFSVPVALMSPLSFLAEPSRWLWALHRHRATLTASPNFGYELCLNRIPDDAIEGLDLSSLRYMLNGAEPVSPDTVRRFNERFMPRGLRPNVLKPVYGLAETCVGLALPSPEQAVVGDRISRDAFSRTGRATQATPDDPNPLLWMGCGSPLPGEQVRIVDQTGIELPERREGRIEFKGPSATSGYYRNPQATRRLFRGDDWLDTGDRGYMAGGELFITGRDKDVIIRAGRNIYPYELEEAIGEVPGIRKGCVAVFASQRPSAPENLILIAETRETAEQALGRLRQQIYQRTIDLLAIPADEIVLAPPHTVLKTSSGKIRRNATRELFERGLLGRGRGWRAIAILFGTLRAEARHGIQVALRISYSGWAWWCFYAVASIAWLSTLLLPRLGWRWRALRALGRLLRLLTATGFTVEGLENVPASGACVLAANHCSYLDSLVLVTAVPRPFHYVVKREVKGAFVVRLFLRRLGVHFVERFDPEQSSEDARALTRAAQRGQSLAFFPEGTFTRVSGLCPFHMGAFVTAATAGLPVVPVSIRGTRSKLRPGQWWVRPGPLAVVVSPPVQPGGSDWRAAIALKDATRAAILDRCDEPDLAG